MAPFFSIIIPTLNEEKYISKLLNCLISQKVSNFEVLLIDGNSQDKTKEITLSYKNKIPITFHVLSKGNLSLQKNKGAYLALGEYLIFLDADMLINNSFTQIAEREINRRKGFVFIPYVYPIEKREYPEVSSAMSIINQLIGVSLEINKPFSAGPSQIWERQVFYKIGGYDELFGEDHQIMRKAHLWGLKIRQLAKLRVKFSLRRLRQEGRVKLFAHFIRSHIHLLFNDKTGKAFEYEMGGHVYSKKKILQPNRIKINFHNISKQINSAIRKFILED